MQRIFFVRSFKTLSVIFLLAVFVFGGILTLKAEAQDTGGLKQTETLAKVSLGNGELLQVDNKITLNFSLQNKSSPISAIRTSVLIFSEDLSKILNEKYLEGSVALDTNEIKTVSIPYVAPSAFSGSYRVGIRVQTETNLPLGILIFPQTISLSGETRGVFVDPSTCYLMVSGEPLQKTYTLAQGVDVLPSEKITLSCLVKNLSNTSIDTKVFLNTYHRSQSGKLISENIPGDTFNFKSLEGRRLQIPLILPAEPQAYDTVVTLNTDGVVSNEVKAHFVVRGPSATIQTFSLDKTSYKERDIAQAYLVWTPSADSFPGSRLGSGASLVNPQLVVSLFSEKGPCAKDEIVSLSSDRLVFVHPITIEEKCVAVKANIRIMEGDKELASLKYDVPPLKDSSMLFTDMFFVLIGFCIAIIVGIFYIFRTIRKNKIPTNIPPYVPPMAALILFFGLSFSFCGAVFADTVTWKDKVGNDLTGTINIASDWDEGVDISFGGDFTTTYQVCGNGLTRQISFGYEIRTGAGELVTTKHGLRGPIISENIGQLQVGNYILRSFFGDSEEYKIDRYEEGVCQRSIDNDGDGFEDDVDFYSCQLPVYVLSGLTGMATVDIPLKLTELKKNLRDSMIIFLVLILRVGHSILTTKLFL